MHRVINGICIASTMAVLAVGCESAAKKQVEERHDAKQEIAKAGQDAEKKIQNAQEDLADAEKKYGEKVADAQKGIAEEVKEANKEIGKADAEQAKDAAEARYAHFDVITNESETAFASRARTAISELQTDLDGVTKKATASTDAKLASELDEAKKALDEARKDLTELQTKSGKLFDDGRVGVGTAINKTQRELEDVHAQLANLKM